MNEVTKTAEFQWDEKRILAAQLLAENDLTYTEIAEKVGVHRKTIAEWKKYPEFSNRVREHTKNLDELHRRHSIGMRSRRLGAYQNRWQKMKDVIDDRANDPEMQDIPGGKTGLLVKQYKKIGKQTFKEYKVDVGLLKELRELEKQTAIELGQWQESLKVLSMSDDDITKAIETELARVAGIGTSEDAGTTENDANQGGDRQAT